MHSSLLVCTLLLLTGAETQHSSPSVPSVASDHIRSQYTVGRNWSTSVVIPAETTVVSKIRRRDRGIDNESSAPVAPPASVAFICKIEKALHHKRLRQIWRGTKNRIHTWRHEAAK
jgi:hypothetical protein